MTWKQQLVQFCRCFGVDLIRYLPDRHPEAQLQKLLEVNQIDVVIDVGANIGQYASKIRKAGFRGRIVSFEPLNEAFSVLEVNAGGDSMWDVRKCAIGAQRGATTIHVAGNSTSSSLLEMLPAHLAAAPASQYVAKQNVEVECLNDLIPLICKDSDRVHLKIDTQGFEKEVLRGADQVLHQCKLIQLEMSLVPLYGGAPSFSDLMSWMGEWGYRLIALHPGFTDLKTAEMLQLDGVFLREVER